MTGWYGFVSDPSFGVPVLLLAGTLALWWALHLHEYPTSVLRRTARPVADRDAVSRTVNAFETGRFSEVLRMAQVRLDRTARSRFGVPAARLPRTSWGLRRLAGADPAEVRAVRRLNARVERLEAVSIRRESGIWLRLDFWRSRDEILRRFRVGLLPLLSEVTQHTTGPTGRAA